MSLRTVVAGMAREIPTGWHSRPSRDGWETCAVCGNVVHEEWVRDDGVHLVQCGWSRSSHWVPVWKTYEKSGSRIDYLSDLEMHAYAAMEEVNATLPMDGTKPQPRELHITHPTSPFRQIILELDTERRVSLAEVMKAIRVLYPNDRAVITVDEKTASFELVDAPKETP